MSRISAARLEMLTSGTPDLVFYMSVLAQLKWEKVPRDRPDGRPMTLAVTPTTISWADEFVDTLTHGQAVAALCHEAVHIVLGHPWRRGHRNPELWNIACDIVDNDSLAASDVGVADTAWLCDFSYTREKVREHSGLDIPTDITTEGVYQMLVKAGFEPTSVPGDGDVCGGTEDADGTQEGGDALSHAIIMEAASRMAEATVPGSTPDTVKRMLDDVKTSRVSWADQFHHAMQAANASTDWTYDVPDENYLHTGLIMPSEMGQHVGDVAICLDTSGSVMANENVLSRLVSEIVAVFEQVQVESATVVYADSEIKRVDRFDDASTVDFEAVRTITGGGGTSFDPPFAYIEDHSLSPSAVVYLTDGYGDVAAASDPSVPTIWLVVGSDSFDPPFGRVIRVEE